MVERIIREIRTEGCKIVMTTHNLEGRRPGLPTMWCSWQMAGCASMSRSVNFSATRLGGSEAFSYKENSRGKWHSEATVRRKRIFAGSAGRGRGGFDHAGIDHFNRAVRAFRTYPADLREEDGHHRQGRGARHRSGSRRRPARRCGCLAGSGDRARKTPSSPKAMAHIART